MFFRLFPLINLLFLLLWFLPNLAWSDEIAHQFLVALPLVEMYEECSADSPRVSQALYGERISVVEERDDGWVLIETEDWYRGYSLFQGFVPDGALQPASGQNCRIASVAALIYPTAGTEFPALLILPYGVPIHLLEDFNTGQNRWLKVQLLDGRQGWVQRGDLERPRKKSIEEILALAHRFLERPYIWGGKSSFGFDCSGFIQTLFKEAGIELPRDCKEQAQSPLLEAIPAEERRPGDLLFFGSKDRVHHVGLYLGENRFIHTGVRNESPKTAIIGLDSADYVLHAVRRVREP